MNPSFTSTFTTLACLSLPFLGMRAALMTVAIGSLVGSYALGSEDGLRILPGPLLAACYCLCLALRAAMRRSRPMPRFPGSRKLRWFLLYAVVVTATAPVLFGASVTVIQPGAVSDGIREALPLQWSSSSIAQTTYLILNAILLAAAVRAGRRPGAQIGWTLRVHQTVGVVLAAAVSLELVLGGVGFRVDFFSWLMGDSFTEFRRDRYALDAVFGLSIRRAQAIFGEPSSFSVYMTGLFAAALIQARARLTPAKLLRLVLFVVALLASFSTTAMFGLLSAGAIASFVPLEVHSATPAQRRTARSRRRLFMLVLALIAVALIAAVLLSDSVFDYLFGKLTDVEGYEEGNYSSGAERLFWDLVAGRAIMDSYGLGVGAGGTRASSFILNFGASFGVVGLIALAALLVLLVRTLFRALPLAQNLDLRAALAMWIGWFIGLAVSVPDGLSFFYVWIQLGFIFALLQVRTTARRIGPSPVSTSPA